MRARDGRGLRTSKVQLDAQGAPIASTRVRYVYGPEGLLHAETVPGSTTLGSVYIWLNGEPIGLIRNNTLYHVHSDHLGRPEVVTNASRTIVWRAENLAWDRKVVTSSIGAYNLGFPGQYRDSESAQWYNYFRTYDGSIGRYTQSDPIGLAGGMNTYLYANANPASFIDPNGLQTSCPTREQCINECLSDRYGAAYAAAISLLPITAGAFAASGAASVYAEYSSATTLQAGTRNLYAASPMRGFPSIDTGTTPRAGARQLAMRGALATTAAVSAVTTVGAGSFATGAYLRCRYECR